MFTHRWDSKSPGFSSVVEEVIDKAWLGTDGGGALEALYLDENLLQLMGEGKRENHFSPVM